MTTTQLCNSMLSLAMHTVSYNLMAMSCLMPKRNMMNVLNIFPNNLSHSLKLYMPHSSSNIILYQIASHINNQFVSRDTFLSRNSDTTYNHLYTLEIQRKVLISKFKVPQPKTYKGSNKPHTTLKYMKMLTLCAIFLMSSNSYQFSTSALLRSFHT